MLDDFHCRACERTTPLLRCCRGLARGLLYNAEASHADASQVTFGVTVPAPGAIAVLGLFGLAGARRRR